MKINRTTVILAGIGAVGACIAANNITIKISLKSYEKAMVAMNAMEKLDEVIVNHISKLDDGELESSELTHVVVRLLEEKIALLNKGSKALKGVIRIKREGINELASLKGQIEAAKIATQAMLDELKQK